ncbi:MAG: hypothetical protein KA284_07465 [Bacteroidia bacterium]|nr:hypothetical protein [Bacteroidia bacterium]
MNTDLKPEDFWSGAEILLDNHYKVKRRRKAALWIISVLTIAGSLLYIASDKSVILSDSHKGIETPVAAIEKNSPEENNSLQKNISENNSSIKTTGTENHKTEILTEQNISSKNTNSINKKNNTELPRIAKTEKQSTANSFISKNTLPISSGENKSATNSKAQTTVQGTPDISSGIFATNNIIESNLITKEDISSDATVVAFSSESNKTQLPVYALHSRHFNKFEIERAQHQLNSTRGEEIKTPKSKNTAEYRFEIFAGVNQISKSISGFENLIVELRRNSWETEVLTPQLNLAVSRSTDHFSIALGLGYTQYGEKVNYDPGVKSMFLIDNSYWNTFLTNVIVTDTNYVYGFVYLSQQTIQRLDSNYIQQSDSIEQIVINQNILKSTGTNIISYVEMPVTLSYYFGKKKFKYGVSAGVSAGMLVYSKGYYLNNAGNDVVKISDPDLFRKIILNGQVGLELKYCMSPGIHILLRPKYQMNLNSIVKDDAGFEQKYSAVGISAGVSFMLK